VSRGRAIGKQSLAGVKEAEKRALRHVFGDIPGLLTVRTGNGPSLSLLHFTPVILISPSPRPSRLVKATYTELTETTE